MEYRKFGDIYAVRLAPGDEVCSSLLALCKQEKLGAGTVSGIGAAGRATLGVYRVAEQVYVSRSLEGEFEIASLAGNISRQAGQPYLHLHATLSDADGGVYAGHHAFAQLHLRRLPDGGQPRGFRFRLADDHAAQTYGAGQTLRGLFGR